MNNSSTTDIYDECVREDFPYRVMWYNFTPSISIVDYRCYTEPKKEESIDSRFDILDIGQSCKSYDTLTAEKLKRYFDKIKKELNNNSVWKDPEPKCVNQSLSEESLVEYIQRDMEENFREILEKLIEDKIRSERFEIMDL